MTCFDRALYTRGCLLQPEQGVPAVRMSLSACVFVVDLRFEFGGKTIAGMSAAWQKQRDRAPPKLYFNRTKVLTGVGTVGLLAFKSVCDRRQTEVCITGSISGQRKMCITGGIWG